MFTNYVDKFLALSDHLPPSIDIFYLINVDKKSTFLDYLSTRCGHVVRDFESEAKTR